ncbi:K+/H+ antiporter subunit F [Falsochrobactrum ovis]|uniref:Multisubunit potassium/proton antiporter PhaF subunit n=1 Tax=Falsochrobactrum ovis TaxID=1293442 RepID=A0A364JWR6_9HYPH|nr:K+/H+ antiporter subunit F [Falsochrobactrum ovis]RAK30907.1 multisubunit potassium/proton antiporter PhaF subunit [Falsochrobactrum ovis]
MSAVILFWSLLATQFMLVIAMGCTVYRLLVGPRAQDRILATDALYLNSLMLLLTFGMRTGNIMYFEAALIIALLSFVGTVALAKFLMRGEVIE